MEVGSCSIHHKFKSVTQHHKRKRKHKGVNDGLGATGINELPDDVLISILSRLSLKEASRTSVLSRRWRYLWMFLSTLEFDDKDVFSSTSALQHDETAIATRNEIIRQTFKALVNRVVDFHRYESCLNCLIIRFTRLRLRPHYDRPHHIHKWIYFAMRKTVKMFELDLSTCRPSRHSYYEFPSVDKLLLHSHDEKFGFVSLRSLRLVHVDIRDEVVHYFLASCLCLEELCIIGSFVTKNLRVVDPLPNLKVLGVSSCLNIRSLEVLTTNLVSCTYGVEQYAILPFKEVPNLSELNIGGRSAMAFIDEPNRHSSYLVQLVKLTLSFPEAILESDLPDLPQLNLLKRLELNILSVVGRGLLFYTSFIKVCPLLSEFRIKISYELASQWDKIDQLPQVYAELEDCHKNLKVFTMSGYIGCSSEDKFVLQLLDIAPSLETITIDTESEYYVKEWDCPYRLRNPFIWQKCETGARTRFQAQERAQRLKFSFWNETSLIVT